MDVTTLRYAMETTPKGIVVRDSHTDEIAAGPYGDVAAANRAVDDLERKEMVDDIAVEVEGKGWPVVAADIRDGVPLATILCGLRQIGEGDSDAAAILAEAIEGRRGGVS
ncbi:MAG TPA: hypothetical protein VII45_03910 [Solirubrobacterales bacterium]